MMKEVLREPIFVREIIDIIRSSHSADELRDRLRDYHDNDIAQSLEFLNQKERIDLYNALGAEWMAEIISYLDEPAKYVDDLGTDRLAKAVNEMDADDAVDFWDEIDESVREKLRPMLDEDVKTDIKLINSYDDDEILTAAINGLYISAFISRKDDKYNVHFLVHQYPESMKAQFEEAIMNEVINYMISTTILALRLDCPEKVNQYIGR